MNHPDNVTNDIMHGTSAERLKLKCPTCWAETYVVVYPNSNDEKEVIEGLRHAHHDMPTVVRREQLNG